MSQALVLLWLSAQPSLGGQPADTAQPPQAVALQAPPGYGTPTATDRTHLDAWSRAHRIELRPAASEALPRPYDSTTISHIEALLERAHVAASALDHAEAAGLLDQARGALRAAPTIPQAPWLMAQAFYLSAEVAEHAGETTEAAAYRSAARVLEGTRAPAHAAAEASKADGRQDTPAAGDPSSSGRTRPLTIDGLTLHDALVWDGLYEAASHPLIVESAPGLHHALVLRSGTTRWAGWVEVAASQLELPIPPPAVCSLEDLTPTSWVGPRLQGAPHTRCSRWIAARATERGIEVAECRYGQCEAWESWPRAVPAGALEPPTRHLPDETASTPFPWWGYAILGGALAATAGAIVWEATQNQSDSPTQTVWVFGGVK